MSYETELLQLVVITGLVVLLGAIVCFYAFRIFARTHQRSMAYLGVGFALISAGAALTWFGLWWSGMDPLECQFGTTGVSALGFGAIIYSLRTRAG